MVQGDEVRLSCPHENIYTVIYWYSAWYDDDPYGSYEWPVASMVRDLDINVREPWRSRAWNMDITNGDLIIPEVLLSDEGEYYCGGTTGRPTRVTLSVHGEFWNSYD